MAEDNFGIGRLPRDDPNPPDTGPSMRDVRDALRGPQTDDDVEGPCANCGRSGYWVCGAGRFLCVRHEENY